MGLTGVIYALVVLAWAAYLLPQALRRHDEVARKHSIERFSSAMRVLARRGSSRSDQFVVTPPRTGDRLLTPSLTTPTTPDNKPSRPRPSRATLKAAAVRRRRVVVVLVSVTLVTVVVAAFGLAPWWLVSAPLALIVAFLMVARRQVRRASESYWDDLSVQPLEPSPSNVVTRPATRVDASHGSVKLPARGVNGDSADDEPTVTLDREALREAVTEVGVVATADGESLWDPLPVTLPTYVEKPVAKRSYRTIQLGEPGTWSSGHSEKDSKSVASGATATTKPEADDAAIDDTPQAVNG